MTATLTRLLALLPLAACATEVEVIHTPDGGPLDADDAVVTYFEDVAPIYARACWSCHQEGGLAVPMVELDAARSLAQASLAATTDGSMPPAPVDPSCGPIRGLGGVRESERATLATWIAMGMLEGDPARRPAIPAPPRAARLPDPTARVTLTGSAEPRCYPIEDLAPDATAFLTAFGADGPPALVRATLFAGLLDATSARAEVEALDAADAGPGWACQPDGTAVGAPMGPVATEAATRGAVGIWSRGRPEQRLPPGAGIRIGAAQPAFVRVELDGPAAGAEVAVHVTRVSEVAHPLSVLVLGPSELDLPARVDGAPTTFVTSSPRYATPIARPLVWGVGMAMGPLGVAARVESDRCLLATSEPFDPTALHTFWFERNPRPLGATVALSCTHTLLDRDVPYGNPPNGDYCFAEVLVEQ